MYSEEKKVNIYKVIGITVGAVLLVSAICFAAYKFFKKYFKITFDCGNCAECDNDCFSIDFDPELCDDDFEPACCFDEKPEADTGDTAEAEA